MAVLRSALCFCSSLLCVSCTLQTGQLPWQKVMAERKWQKGTGAPPWAQAVMRELKVMTLGRQLSFRHSSKKRSASCHSPLFSHALIRLLYVITLLSHPCKQTQAPHPTQPFTHFCCLPLLPALLSNAVRRQNSLKATRQEGPVSCGSLSKRLLECNPILSYTHSAAVWIVQPTVYKVSAWACCCTAFSLLSQKGKVWKGQQD